MIVVTTPYLTGHRVVESKGMVFGLVVRSRGLGGNLMAGLRSLGGGEIHEYTSLLEDTRRQALDRLVQNATLMGANAVLSMRFDSSELAGTMSEIVAYGTAVVVAPDSGAGAGRAPRRADDGPQPCPPARPGRGLAIAVLGLWLIALPGGRARSSDSRRSSGWRLVVGALIERIRYRSDPLDRRDRRRPGGGEPPGDAARAALPRKDEVFVDPTSGRADARLVDPSSGERRYVAED